jgi:tripartite-type tricarboxylate transporter receptor subunit TctC
VGALPCLPNHERDCVMAAHSRPPRTGVSCAGDFICIGALGSNRMQWNTRICFAAALAALACAGAFGSRALAQDSRPIRLILPFPPGGPADAMARIVAQHIGEGGGPSVVVESHPGAATEIGTEYVAQAPPDGYTLAIISNSFVVLPNVRQLKYDPLTDFVPICQVASFPPLIVVNSNAPYRTLADFIAAAHATPGTLTLATIGPATSSQLTFEMLKRAAKADITFVPFPGYTPAIQALLSNTVTAVLADLSSLQGQLQTGKLRALATTSSERISLLPNVPTVIESGYKDVSADFFGGVIAPVKTPKPMINKLTAWFSAAINDPKVKAKFKTLGFFPGGACGPAFDSVLRKDYDDYRRIITDARLKMQ